MKFFFASMNVDSRSKLMCIFPSVPVVKYYTLAQNSVVRLWDFDFTSYDVGHHYKMLSFFLDAEDDGDSFSEEKPLLLGEADKWMTISYDQGGFDPLVDSRFKLNVFLNFVKTNRGTKITFCGDGGDDLWKLKSYSDIPDEVRIVWIADALKILCSQLAFMGVEVDAPISFLKIDHEMKTSDFLIERKYYQRMLSWVPVLEMVGFVKDDKQRFVQSENEDYYIFGCPPLEFKQGADSSLYNSVF